MNMYGMGSWVNHTEGQRNAEHHMGSPNIREIPQELTWGGSRTLLRVT